MNRTQERLPPLVTVVIPVRNEERHIERCLTAVAAQDYRADRLQVVVVDGCSTDATAEAAKRAMGRLGLDHAEVVSNERGTTPSNLNVGLAHALGAILCRVDARSLIPADYVSRCVEVLSTWSEVSVTGGAQVAVPPRPGAVGLGIARALNNRWGMGLSRYRRQAVSGPTDTVYLGAFRTDALRGAGGWDERLATNQDFDLNRRLARTGTVWFDHALEVGYIPRSSFSRLFRQYVRFGRWKVRYWRLTGDRPRPRQLVILAGAPLGALAGVATVVAAPAPMRRLLLGGAVAAAAVVEATGSPGPPAGPLGRLACLTALACTSAGWLGGVALELVQPQSAPSPDQEAAGDKANAN